MCEINAKVIDFTRENLINYVLQILSLSIFGFVGSTEQEIKRTFRIFICLLVNPIVIIHIKMSTRVNFHCFERILILLWKIFVQHRKPQGSITVLWRMFKKENETPQKILYQFIWLSVVYENLPKQNQPGRKNQNYNFSNENNYFAKKI